MQYRKPQTRRFRARDPNKVLIEIQGAGLQTFSLSFGVAACILKRNSITYLSGIIGNQRLTLFIIQGLYRDYTTPKG